MTEFEKRSFPIRTTRRTLMQGAAMAVPVLALGGNQLSTLRTSQNLKCGWIQPMVR